MTTTTIVSDESLPPGTKTRSSQRFEKEHEKEKQRGDEEERWSERTLAGILCSSSIFCRRPVLKKQMENACV